MTLFSPPLLVVEIDECGLNTLILSSSLHFSFEKDKLVLGLHGSQLVGIAPIYQSKTNVVSLDRKNHFICQVVRLYCGPAHLCMKYNYNITFNILITFSKCPQLKINKLSIQNSRKS